MKILDVVVETSITTIVTIASKACFRVKEYLVLVIPMGRRFHSFGRVIHLMELR